MSYLQPVTLALRLQQLSQNERFPNDIRESAQKVLQDVRSFIQQQDQMDSLEANHKHGLCKKCGEALSDDEPEDSCRYS